MVHFGKRWGLENNHLKFGDDDKLNLYRVNIKEVLVPHFIENIFRSGFTLFSSNDIITKIDNKICLKKTPRKETNKKDFF